MKQRDFATVAFVEFFDRHPRLPPVLLVLLAFACHGLPFLFGGSTDPLWSFATISQNTRLMPGAPFLDPNVGFTSQALGHLAAWDWVHGVVPWWNPYSGVGMPLAGELQPGAFFLPFNLLLLLPGGILLQQIVLQAMAGLMMYALLRELELTRLAALLGGALLVLNGVFAWAPGPVGVYCALPFLPMMLWGIERARRPGQGALSTLAVGCGIAWSLLGGFPEPAYFGGLLALAWGVYRLVQADDRWRMARLTIGGFLLGLLVAAPPLVAFLAYLQQSDSLGVHDFGAASLPGAAVAMSLVPYIFGPATIAFAGTAVRDTWGSIGGYTGVLILLLAALALTRLSREKAARRGLKLVLAGWVLLAWCKTFGVWPVLQLMNFVPMVRHAAFYRYAPSSWTFALIVLAAIGLDDLREAAGAARRKAFLAAVGFAAVAFLLVLPVAVAAEGRGKQALIVAVAGVSLLWTLAGLTAARWAWRRPTLTARRATLAAVLVLDAAAMFLFPELSAQRGNRLDGEAIAFLQAHQGLSRMHTLGPIQPNYGAYFGVASINHNVLPVPRLWQNYVNSSLVPGYKAFDSGVSFDPSVFLEGLPQQDLADHLASYQEVGTRYVVTQAAQSPYPLRFVPALARSADGMGSGEPFVAGLGKNRLKVHARLRGTADDASKLKVERTLADRLDRMAFSQISVADVGSMALNSGESAGVRLQSPPPTAQGRALTSVGVMLGANPGAGVLEVRVCAGELCRTGQRSLSAPVYNSLAQVPLDAGMELGGGVPLSVTFTPRGTTGPLELLLGQGPLATGEAVDGPRGPLPGRAFQLVFAYQPANVLPKVYSDALLDIYELPAPAPYYEVGQGGPCTLSGPERESVTAECAAPATLLRREMYMPGWQVSAQGGGAGAVTQAGLWQSTQLAAGRSTLRYSFVPPHMELGWIAFALGTLGLLWQAILAVRERAATRRYPA